jgi:bifunctional UDP-N-acetylglucosamine pyrophosphorylase/glucosamine-1-phosphate N-acetyltransferase
VRRAEHRPLADARRALRRRVNRAWALAGVDFADLEAASVDVDCVLRPDAHIGFGAVVEGRSDIGGSIGTHSVVRDSVVEAGAAVKEHSVLEAAHVCAGAVVGPFARLRPGAVIEPEAHIGNFVEVKNARVRRGAKANHLAYLGDADIGERANIGAGTITCNYDGFGKYRTDIGAGAFIGSNTALVAPVRVGDNAIIGAGSTITEDVPAEAVAIARGAQVTKPDLAPKIRGRAKARKELMIQRDKA